MSEFAYLDELVKTIAARDGGDPKTSHTAKLLKRGPARIAKKVGEEGVEVAIAAAQKSADDTVLESADLLFHLLVLWRSLGIAPSQVMDALKAREGVSGIEEKANRVEE